MVEQYIENQYDDDLTVGTDDYDDSYYTDADDLFAFSADEESPISRLKSLILSIDWEITDEILLQFNEELLDLRDIWTGEKVNLVYVQALEKISKYIYQKKADSHPSAIKLLLTLYHNLEKIVSSPDLSVDERNAILAEDVKRFERLKQHINQRNSEAGSTEEPPRNDPTVFNERPSRDSELQNLKAIVLGIDWEITDKDLDDLRAEVVRLEERFADSRPRLILLQGIGTLGAYIKLKKSNAHADAFKVLHLFYESLEAIVAKPLSIEQEKEILFPAVERFNSFKTLLGPTISPESISRSSSTEEDEAVDTGSIAPALADVSADDAVGFQADKEARELGLQDVDNVDSHVESFFTDQEWGSNEHDENFAEKVPESVGYADIDGDTSDEGPHHIGKDLALQGVDVEEDGVPPSLTDGVATLSDSSLDIEQQNIESARTSDTTGFAVDDAVKILTGTQKTTTDARASEDNALDPMPGHVSDSDGIKEAGQEVEQVEFSESEESLDELPGEDTTTLQGVDVETEADDDSGEEPLHLTGGDLAPALTDTEEDYEETDLSVDSINGESAEDVLDHIDSFFEETDSNLSDEMTSELDEMLGDFIEPVEDPGMDEKVDLPGVDSEQEETPIGVEKEIALQGVDVESEADDDTEEDALPRVEGLLAPALSTDEETSIFSEDAGQLFSENGEDEELSENLDALFAESIDQDTVDPQFTDHEEIVNEDSPVIAEIESTAISEDESYFNNDQGVVESDLSVTKKASIVPEIHLATPYVPLSSPKTVSLESDEKRLAMEKPSTGAVFPQGQNNVGELKQEELHPESPVATLDEVEEVVFELVEEDSQEPSAPVVSTMMVEDEKSIETGEMHVVELLDQTSSSQAEEGDALAGLRLCVDSLGVEIENKVILGLVDEVHDLNQKWSLYPLEKTFLQLFSTVTQHVDKYRYESSSNAIELMRSLVNALQKCQGGDMQENLELLFVETSKVVNWQQGMLDRQAIKDGDERGFTRPLRSDSDIISDAQSEFDEAYLALEEEQDDPELRGSVPEGVINAVDTEDLQTGINSLRQSLQNDIEELKKEMGEEKKI